MSFIEKYSKKYSLYIFVGVGVIVAYLMLQQLIIPTATQTFENYQLLTTKKEQLAELTKKRTILQSISEETLTFLADAEAALPSEKDAAGVLISMDNLTRLTSFGVASINLSPGVVSTESAKPTASAVEGQTEVAVNPNIRKGAEFLPVTIVTSGTTDQFLDFIQRLENSRRVMDIETIALSITPDGSLLDAQISLVAYYLPAITTIGKVDSALPNVTEDEQATLENLSSMPVLSVSLVDGGEASFIPAVGKTNLFTR